MIFKQVTPQAIETKQLILNDTHIELADDRNHITYPNGIPKQIIFNDLKHKFDSVTIETNSIIVIGRKRSMRDYEVNVDFTDMDGATLGVSHYHAMMLIFDSAIYIKDLDSLNGMRLNGKRLQPSKEYLIDNGDILAFGNLEVKIQFSV